MEVVDPACGRWGYASGTADLRTGRPMDVRDRLRIGSITKTFTAATVLQLADEGRLSLDAFVEHYLPGLVQGNGYDGNKITVRQLLQQTSGPPDHSEALATADVEWLRHHHFTPQDLVRRALRLPPPAHPWHCSTTDYILAGLLIEKATGRPAEAEISRRIIKPLDLHDTYWPGDAERIRGPHSRSYFTTEEDGKAVRWTAPSGTPRPGAQEAHWSPRRTTSTRSSPPCWSAASCHPPGSRRCARRWRAIRNGSDRTAATAWG
ncbi:D-alanyl-D-alanine carboxypeptidase precursor [Streptomyces lavendulae subsp. lavendulae]|uniref:D-alanyl-D-alanine carboxypeptidase n=1 Tax=Streptomyces lavendulae subsp. lavendulae TaxID=58340 RepID=A0A2K8PQU5_STRLA|nr:serine hydrolase domain-containing protein [Streptomyces lavendulae]ATZ29111.1 D-alanyl-D-alanine carboxypeptidase precursor [Streptomyces lavendulae subsp. lavendulae]QUQ58931.1 D-aminopeptidase [Streptomyces lavendulae subsp. lavendulae]